MEAEEGPEQEGTSTAARSSLLPIPGYTVVEELARGGMGIVYRAWQHAPARVVALKMLLPISASSRELRDRFQLEARTLSELDHPAILPIYETGEHDQLPWFSMKLATGGSLADRARSLVGRWHEIAALMITLAEAVQYAHDRGVLHRDLKPANLLFDADGRPFIADFGLAKLIRPGSDVTQSQWALGTPHYLAPEVAASNASRATTASDVYSLGAILFELLAGRPPFEADGLPALLRQIVEEEPVLPPSPQPEAQPAQPDDLTSPVEPGLTRAPAPIPRDLAVITRKCLAKDPSRRYASARELAEELRRFQVGEPILARTSSAMDRAVLWCRRQPALAAATAGIALLLIGLAATSFLAAQRIERLRRQGLVQLYASDMRLAQQAIAESKFGPAAELLERHQPKPGDPDLRGFEWWHFQERCRSEEFASLEPQTNPVQRVAFSPDGRFLAAAGTELRIWNFSTRQLLVQHPMDDFVWALAFSPDGTQLCAGTGNGSIFRFGIGPAPKLEFTLTHLGSRPLAFAWETRAFPLRMLLRNGWAEWDGASATATRPANADGLFARARVTIDGRIVATLTGPRQVETWRVHPPLRISTFPLPNIARALDIAPDGRSLAVGEYSGTLRVFQAGDGGRTNRVAAHRGLIECTEFSPDGRRIASAGVDQTIRLHDAATGERLGEWQGHRATILALAFSPNGRWLMSGDKLGAIKLWDTATPPPRTGPVRDSGARLSVDGAWGTAYSSPTSVVVRSFATPVRSAEEIPISANALILASARGVIEIDDQGRLRTFETKTGWRDVPLHDMFVLREAAVSPDGQFVALRVKGIAGLLVWHLAAAREAFRATNDPTWLNPTFSADGRRLACGSARGVVHIWEVPSGRVVATIPAHRNYAYDCDLSRDGRRVATAGFDGWVKLWEVESGRLLGEYRSTGDAYWTVALSPNGRRIAAGTSESSIVLWDVSSRLEVATFPLGDPIAPVEGRLRFTPNGSALLRANGVLNHWTAPGYAEAQPSPR